MDVDLTPFGAKDKGVSRLHAAIEVSADRVTIADLGSANGTYLNAHRLSPHQPRILRDGDELRFGDLVASVYFRSE